MKSRLGFYLGTTILSGVLLSAAGAAAQDSRVGPDAVIEVEDVVVTGSRLRRSAIDSPTPLIQVEREVLLATGQASMIDYLATIPALMNSAVPSAQTGSILGDGGLSTLNLRSLGAGRTLTLVDGRRHVGSSSGSLAVDVDTIPRLLVQNVEIVTGGASSVYGADAVSGVINYVMRKNFDGVEVDAQYGMLNQSGQAGRRISALVGKNLFDDRLNLYAHAEYDASDEVTSLDIDWLRRAPIRLGLDADPTTARYDGKLDADVFRGVSSLVMPRWGQTTLANVQRPSDLTNPNVPYENCFPNGAFSGSWNCFAVSPGQTFWYEGGAARHANFGQRVGNTGIHRVFNIGGDGDNPAISDTASRLPEATAQRYQVGGTFRLNDAIELSGEAKYVSEETYDIGGPTFFEVRLANAYRANQTNPITGLANFGLRWEDNAFLPDNVKAAIRGNMVTPFAPPTAEVAGQPLPAIAVPEALHVLYGPDRTHRAARDLQRYVVRARGEAPSLGFVDNFRWDLSYTYGKVDVELTEVSVDSQKFALAADAVLDLDGRVNGKAGEVVCRAQLLAAQGAAAGSLVDRHRGGDLRDTSYGRDAIAQCAPLNIFGKGVQSAAALQYVDAPIRPTERNEQEQAVAYVAGDLWNFWGAGPISLVLGAEYRRESTSATGRDRDVGGRMLFHNDGVDFNKVSYSSSEAFAEVSLPLVRDSIFGEYAEIGASYRYSDYTTVGEVDVYGLNIIYRPISDLTFKSSYNTSVRVPNLMENFGPYRRTYFNNVNDPCATLSIANVSEADKKANRIKNCTALAADQGLLFDFAGATPENLDDFRPVYESGIPGVVGGNVNLKPEESTSFTFSTIFQPRVLPSLSLVFDYYEIKIEQMISAVTPQSAANLCVEGDVLNTSACSTIFRNHPDKPFAIGAPTGDRIGAFIQGSLNYAKLETRGVDFSGNYRLELDEVVGRPWGSVDYSLRGSWLIEQKQFVNVTDPSDFTEYAGMLRGSTSFPRVRLTSSLTWKPNDAWSVNWSMDWQSAQNIIRPRDFITNADQRRVSQMDTGNFTRHDLALTWVARDDLVLRTGVINLFDAEQPDYLGMGLYRGFDHYGRRFFVGLNYRR